MDLKSVETPEEAKYEVTFEGALSGHRVEMKIEFFEGWRFGYNDNILDNLQNKLGEVEYFDEEYPPDPNRGLVSKVMHIPNEITRHIFKTCMQVFIEKTSAPIHVTISQHPGYPVLVIIYNNMLITDPLLDDLVLKIMEGMETAEITKEKIEEEGADKEESEDDPLDNLDDADYVDFDMEEAFEDEEFESDEEKEKLMSRLKHPEEKILPLEGDRFDD